MVNPADRIRDLIGDVELDEGDVFTYSYVGGYETLHYNNYHYSGSHHPNGVCEGDTVCTYCGSLLVDKVEVEDKV